MWGGAQGWRQFRYRAEDAAGAVFMGFCSHFPFRRGPTIGGSFPWEKDPDKAIVACPDAENPVVFELRERID